MNDTIVAQCSPQGTGAISLIRVSGTHAFECVDKVAQLASKKRLADVATHTIHHGLVVDPSTNHTLDDVMFLAMRAPRTFTGQDSIEITCHGNPIIIQKIIDVIVAAGARHAERGEFTRRALENGKLDLLQAEAIHDLIVAQTEQAAQAALGQVHGSLSHHIQQIEQLLVNVIMLTEASFEFGAEEHDDLNYDHLVHQSFEQLTTYINQLTTDINRQKYVQTGYRIACVGSVNAGKSTLFNALINRERAIVSNIPGTTRDVVDATIYHHGNTFTLVDTAGLRITNDVIESLGIAKTWDEAALADVILLIIDATREVQPLEQEVYDQLVAKYGDKIICVMNKMDEQIFARPEPPLVLQQSAKALANAESKASFISASGLKKTGISEIFTAIEHKVAHLNTTTSTPFILNARHIALISQLAQVLEQTAPLRAPVIQYELLAHHLREALAHTAQLTGKNLSETILDHVFASFCVGK